MWTYSGDPKSSKGDEVRFLIGDTDKACEELLQDEEIAFLLSQTGDNALAAAIEACYRIAAKFSRLVDNSVMGVSVSAGQRAQKYYDLAENLKRRRHLYVLPFVGGVEVADKEERDADTSAVQPIFKLGMDDYPQQNDSLTHEDEDE